MILSDVSIWDAVQNGELLISPLPQGPIQPCSIDLRLGHSFKTMRQNIAAHEVIDPERDNGCFYEHTPHLGPNGELYLDPRCFALASTLERITLSSALAGRLEGKSSLGRLGLLVHATAGYIDAGWDGHITLELYNVATAPIILRPGMKIGQLSLICLTTPAARPYGHPDLNSKYKGQVEATTSRYHQNYGAR